IAAGLIMAGGCGAVAFDGTRCKARTSASHGACPLHRRAPYPPVGFHTAFAAFRDVTIANEANRDYWFWAEGNGIARRVVNLSSIAGRPREQFFVVNTGTRPIDPRDAHLVDYAFVTPHGTYTNHAYMCHVERNNGVCPLPSPLATGEPFVVECV
ncbi:MAG: hypothetical protein VW103_04540, partial [Halieaceae bacterium]